jgi:hypothetical protein
LVLALIAIVAFGIGFTIHRLFVVAVVFALLWLISLLRAACAAGRAARGGRRPAVVASSQPVFPNILRQHFPG